MKHSLHRSETICCQSLKIYLHKLCVVRGLVPGVDRRGDGVCPGPGHAGALRAGEAALVRLPRGLGSVRACGERSA